MMRSFHSFLILLVFLPLFSCESVSKKEGALETFSNLGGDSIEKAGYRSMPNEMIITMVPKSLDNPVFLEAKEEAERTVRQYGAKLEWLSPMDTQAEEQERIMESLIRRRVDGIIVSCIDAQRLTPFIDKAVETGIKVATFDSDCPSSKRLFYVGTDNYDIGWASGLQMLKIIKEKGRLHEPLKALLMTGSKQSLNLNERLKGFQDALAEAVDVEYRAVLECNDDLTLAGELLEAYMRSEKGIDLFFSAGGWPLISPVDSLPNYQKWREEGGLAVAVDTFYPIIMAAQKGMADSLVGQDFAMMGRWSVEHMIEAIQAKPLHQSKFYTDLEYADRSNFDKLLQTKEPWEIK
ncbi:MULTISPECIES: substrate-binding domain-containing protein [Paenibacillus]|uniref:substrate-binding domain-containing protein n=1 Tax=Paenibacillus TaxID=44249 RepID=UPI0022B923BE|nr:substrate-binding domain-containing protein [Paenibacillus caseinilyticus]MCZ8517957.1 substrate-binding domain-containing protein [Paenibacillus caseinilyticus]